MWSKEDDENLREIYANISNEQLSNQFNRTEQSIRTHASYLGLKKSKEWIKIVSKTRWTEDVKKKKSDSLKGKPLNLSFKLGTIKSANQRRGKPLSEETRRKISLSLMGHVSPNKDKIGLFSHSTETRKKLSEFWKGKKMAEINPMWKGENVGYLALHDWIKRRFPKPELCQKCQKNEPYDLANKGIYSRDLNNWEWLCRKCHMESDGRMNNLKRNPKLSPEEKKMSQKRSNQKNIERIRKWSIEYQKKNKERIKERMKEWKKKNPEKVKINSKKYYEKKKMKEV